jgi:ABC-type lipoprotein release transport system permease subunit
MFLYIQLAWRNLWRNKKRTLISAASVFFAVLLALVWRSVQLGYYEFMIDASARVSTGYIQVHGKNYWEKKSLDYSVYVTSDVINKIKEIPAVTNVVPRIESYALISSGEVTKVSPVFGIVPTIEDEMTSLKKKITKGEYLTTSSEGILLAEGLANLLKVSVADSVVIYGQGFHGVTAAAQVPVTGILKFAIPSMNNAMSYLSMDYAGWLFSTEGRITSLSILLDNPSRTDDILPEIRKSFNDDYEVMSWEELMPELVQSIQVDNAGNIIMLGILYIVIGFGIFGTVMMMTIERTREFGILISVGMKRWKLYIITTIETIFVSFIGGISGLLASIPLIIYMHNNPIRLTGEMADAITAFGYEPIIPFSIAPDVFGDQMLVVFVIALFSAVYPVLYVKRITPVKALRA